LRWARNAVNCETLECSDLSRVWVAHAARVLVSAARRNELFWSCDQTVCLCNWKSSRSRDALASMRAASAILTADATLQRSTRAR